MSNGKIYYVKIINRKTFGEMLIRSIIVEEESEREYLNPHNSLHY